MQGSRAMAVTFDGAALTLAVTATADDGHRVAFAVGAALGAEDCLVGPRVLDAAPRR